MLDLDPARTGPEPRDAATLVLVRDGIEVFCVERNKKSRFLGGAVVFPGGKLDEGDRSESWSACTTEPYTRARVIEETGFARDVGTLRAFGVAACRESLEEAALLLASDAEITDEDVLALRTTHAANENALAEWLRARGAKLDLGALRPLSRWVTPTVEARRYDTRFFVAAAPQNQTGAHDMTETMASFWAKPADVLRRFEEGDVQLAPPTHRTLEILSSCATIADVFALADRASLDPICPALAKHGDALALCLPGDPDHPVREKRIDGKSRYVLVGDKWLPTDPTNT